MPKGCGSIGFLRWKDRDNDAIKNILMKVDIDMIIWCMGGYRH